VIEEVRRNLFRDRPEALNALEELLRAVTVVPEAPTEFPLPSEVGLPDKDRPVLLAALSALATHFVTGDKRHFGTYLGQSVGGVLVLTPGHYLAARSD